MTAASPTGAAPGAPRYGRGVNRNRRDGSMNGLEKRYAAYLETKLRAGTLARYTFEPVKFRLADKSYYTPDFMLMLPDGEIQFHEVKGGLWLANARTKLKVCAELHPFAFYAVTAKLVRDGGGWTWELI